MNNEHYEKLLEEVLDKIPPDQMELVMGQEYMEYAPCPGPHGFMGFLKVYDGVRRFVPKDYTIIDLGCYYAAQSWLFDDYAGYVGVDVGGGERFAPPNAVHHQCTIREFLERGLHEQYTEDGWCFAICSYVPDDEEVALARQYLPNILTFYPAGVL